MKIRIKTLIANLFPKLTKLFMKIIFSKNKRSFLSNLTKIQKVIKDLPSYKITSLGNKNKNKVFYVIKRFKGGGFFSNYLFVLNHLLIADKLKFIPIVDMKNFSNLYSEKNLINNSKNVWEHLFQQVSKYSLKEVYQSRHVVFSDDNWSKNMSVSYKKNSKNLLKIYKKYIKIKPVIHAEVNNFVKKNFTNHKVLAVHWRGSDHQYLPNHPYPPTKKQIFSKVNKLIKKKGYTKIFFATEDKKNFKTFLNYFGNKVCFYDSFRANLPAEFDNNIRKNHRYNLSKESLIEVMILSKLNTIVCSRSNISEAGVFMSGNNQYKVHEIYNGFSANSLTVALFSWRILSKLPEFLGGFKSDTSKNNSTRQRVFNAH